LFFSLLSFFSVRVIVCVCVCCVCPIRVAHSPK
jgi:hypothetical protein